MKIERVWKKADSLKGVLAHLRTEDGRRRHEEDGDPLKIENSFVADEAKLLSSKTFRLLAKKTQVFTMPESPLVRTRQSHVLEVVAVSVITSTHFGLNTDLVRACAIGHDIGHVPFGHPGEHWMAKAMGRPEFCHEVMGPVIAQHIERKGKGLNLCHETLEGMMRHSGNFAKEGMFPEAWLLRYTDKFTYLFHDVNDVIVRMGYPVKKELRDLVNEFGKDQRERTTTLIAGFLIESAELGRVSFEESELARKFKRLRELMYEIYPKVTNQEVGRSMEPVLRMLETLRIGDPFMLLALMTDQDVVMLSQEKSLDIQAFRKTSVYEIVPYLEEIGEVDMCDPDLDW